MCCSRKKTFIAPAAIRCCGRRRRGTEPMPLGAERIPSLDRLLRDAAFATLLARCGHAEVTRALRGHLDDLRTQARAATLKSAQLTADAIAHAVDAELRRRDRPNLRAVFNLTGTVLHTNLG